MPDYDIDLTLDSLMIPAISATFPFGTKVIPTAENKGGLSTFDVNSNMMLPFTRMRPRVCSADSVTSRVEYDAKIVFSAPQGTTPASGYTLTLGTGDYVGCTVTFTNLLAHACTVRQSDGTTTLFSVPAGKTMSAMWGGSSWLWTTAGSVTAEDLTPVSSAAVHAAIGDDGLLSSMIKIAENVSIPYPANYKEFTMPKDGIATIMMLKDSDGYTCWILRNGYVVFSFSNWNSVPSGSIWSCQLKVKKNDVIRIMQNSVSSSTIWNINDFILSS